MEGPVNRTLLGGDPRFLVTKRSRGSVALPGMHRLDYKTNEKDDQDPEQMVGKCALRALYPSGMMVGHIDGAWKLIDEGWICPEFSAGKL